nr:immunoglobulin light chain junction region [Macaca mulatta]MOX36175.1 immunoglobulin light chain junction region [Macaca mulatta]MOX36406.1 immunoglobulin light chain junction region [Macaca mulatta]MOX36850.1 immunoglobulin light chain junction region [Macaca mulatta]
DYYCSSYATGSIYIF